MKKKRKKRSYLALVLGWAYRRERGDKRKRKSPKRAERSSR